MIHMYHSGRARRKADVGIDRTSVMIVVSMVAIIYLCIGLALGAVFL